MIPMQLYIRGKPSAFDLSSTNDIVAVSSPGCISFFQLNGFGSPSNVIHYEQPQQIRQLKFQRGNQSYLAAIRGSGLSIWNPAFSVKPLFGLISSSGWITDMDWNNLVPDLFATSCSFGDIQLFDIRSIKSPSQKIPMAKLTVGVQWSSSNPNHLSTIYNEQNVLIFDIRMLSEQQREQSQLSQPLPQSCYKAIELDHDIIQTEWGKDSSYSNILIGTSKGSIEWWDVNKELGSNEYDIRIGRDSILRPPIVDESSAIISSPVGKAAVVTRLNEENDIEIKLHGYARDGHDLGRVFQDPKTDMYSDGPSLTLANSKESVIGMRWGTPGRLYPPAHSGLELLILTESSKLYPIKIPADIVLKYCGGKSLAYSRDPGRIKFNSSRKTQLVPLSSLNDLSSRSQPRYSLDELKGISVEKKLSVGSNEESNHSLIIPRTTSPVLQMGNIYHDTISDIFWKQLKEDIIYLQSLVDNVWLSHLYIGQLDELTRTISLGMTRNLSTGQVSKSFSIIEQDVILNITFPNIVAVESLPTYDVQPYPDSETATSLFSELNVIALTAIGSLKDYDEAIAFHHPDIRKLSDEIAPIDHSTSGYLIGIAQSFRNHILQDWEQKYSLDAIQLILPPINIDGQSSEVVNTESKSKDQNLIEEKAYRVPWPPSSGARFSSRGILLMFGESTFAKVTSLTNTNPSPVSSQFSKLPEPKRRPSKEIDMRLTSIAESTDLSFSNKIQGYNGDSGRSFVSLTLPLPSSADRSRATSLDSKDPQVVNLPSQAPTNSRIIYHSTPTPFMKTYGEKLIQKQMKLEKDEEAYLYDLVMNKSVDGISETGNTPRNLDIDNKSTYSYLSLASSRTKRSDSQNSLQSIASPDLETKLGENLHLPPLGIVSRQASNTSANTRQGQENETGKLIKDSPHISILSKIPEDNIQYSSSFVRAYVVTDILEQNLAHHYDLGPKPRDSSIYENKESMSAALAKACRYNAQQAKKYHASPAIIQIWELLAVSLEVLPIPEISGGLINWSESSLGYTLMTRCISFLFSSGDIVTFGAALCVLGGSNSVKKLLIPPSLRRSSRISSSSSSSSSSLQNQNYLPLHLPKPFTDLNSLEQYMESILVQYADLLYGWCAWNKSTEVRNYFSLLTMKRLEARNKEQAYKDDAVYTFKTKLSTFDIKWYCSRCGERAVFKIKNKEDIHATSSVISLANVLSKNSSSFRRIASFASNGTDEYEEEEDSRLWCNTCRQYGISCGLCQLPIRGINYVCMICGHGGHPEHMKQWFAKSRECPTGCGCRCGDIDMLGGKSSATRAGRNNFHDWDKNKKQSFQTPSEIDYDMGMPIWDDENNDNDGNYIEEEEDEDDEDDEEEEEEDEDDEEDDDDEDSIDHDRVSYISEE